MINAHSMYRYVNDVNNVIITALHRYSCLSQMYYYYYYYYCFKIVNGAVWYIPHIKL